MMCLFGVHLSSEYYRGLKEYLANEKRILIRENMKIIFTMISITIYDRRFYVDLEVEKLL